MESATGIDNPQMAAMQRRIAVAMEVYRQEAEMSRMDVGEALKSAGSYSHRTYYRALRGEQNMSLHTVGLYAAAVKKSPAEILFEPGVVSNRMKKMTVEDLQKNMGAHIKATRNRLKLSKVAMAQHIGVSLLTFYNLELGEQNATLSSIGQIAERLNMSAFVLLGIPPEE